MSDYSPGYDLLWFIRHNGYGSYGPFPSPQEARAHAESCLPKEFGFQIERIHVPREIR